MMSFKFKGEDVDVLICQARISNGHDRLVRIKRKSVKDKITFTYLCHSYQAKMPSNWYIQQLLNQKKYSLVTEYQSCFI
jgi:hypothetical protein